MILERDGVAVVAQVSWSSFSFVGTIVRICIRSLVAAVLVLALLPTTAVGQETSRDTTAVVVAEGTFSGKEKMATSGTYHIQKRSGALRLILEGDFQTESGPDLFVVLSSQDPETATGGTIMDEPAVTVDSLRSLSGKQTYHLDENLDLELYQAVAIHCIEYDHLYGTAALNL